MQTMRGSGPSCAPGRAPRPCCALRCAVLRRHVLWERGQIDKEHLHTMRHPLTADPMHLPHMIPAFQHYLWILKTTHSGAPAWPAWPPAHLP